MTVPWPSFSLRVDKTDPIAERAQLLRMSTHSASQDLTDERPKSPTLRKALGFGQIPNCPQSFLQKKPEQSGMEAGVKTDPQQGARC